MADPLESPPYGIAPWKLNPTNTITEPPEGEFRWDSPTAATAFAVSEVDRLGTDQEGEVFANIVEGDRLVVQQQRAAGKYLVYDIGTPTDQGGWWEIPIVTFVGGTTPTLIDGQDYLFVLRHAFSLPAEAPVTNVVSPPAPLVPVDELDTLVADVVAALTAEVRADPVRDADKLDRAARTAIRDVEIHLDYPSGGDFPFVYATAATVDSQVFDALVTDGASYLKRVGFAYGTAGYDEPDPMAARARGAALAGITTGHKARFGVG